jgi:carbon monoxide dehydrogenase subunit G
MCKAGELFAHIGAKKTQVKGGKMDFGGRYILDAPRETVWAALNDTAMLKAAIPGCHTIEWTGKTTLELAFKVNLGIVRPVFTGDLLLTDVVPAHRYTLTGRGRGGILGHAEGSADIALHEHPDGTLLLFAARGGASGWIMKLGSAVIGQSAQKIIDGFFERFAAAAKIGVTALPVNQATTP